MTDEQQHLRARLELKHEELLQALHALPPDAATQPVFNQLLRQLGLVAFWQSLTDPSVSRMSDIYAALSVMLEVDEPFVDDGDL
jgi:hypothetical protein